MNASVKLSRFKPPLWKVVLVALGLIGAYLSVSNALARKLVSADASIAHAMAPSNGPVTAALAYEKLLLAPGVGGGPEAAELARLALRQDATSVEALNVLALQAELANDNEQVEATFKHALALSRRELRPHLWVIEQAVTAGDLDRTLSAYDVALRTSTEARDMLTPILVDALGEPRIRAQMLSRLNDRPIWAEGFIRYAATSGDNPLGVLALLQDGADEDLIFDRDLRSSLVNGLFADNHLEEAWQLYKTTRPDVQRNLSRDPRFTLEARTLSVFDWVPTNEPNLSVALLGAQDGGIFDFAASVGAKGILLRQRQALEPGTYVLDGESRNIEQPSRSSPYWTLKCINGPELGRIAVPNSPQEPTAFQGSFEVPAGCPFQSLELVARPSDQIGGSSGQLLRAILRANGSAK